MARISDGRELGKKPGAVLKQVGWQLGSWWEDLGNAERCVALGG